MGLCELSRTKVVGQSCDATRTSDALNTLDAFDFELTFGNCAFKDNLLQLIFVPPCNLKLYHFNQGHTPQFQIWVPKTKYNLWSLATDSSSQTPGLPAAFRPSISSHPSQRGSSSLRDILNPPDPIRLTHIYHTPRETQGNWDLCEPSWPITYRIMRGVSEKRGEKATWVLSGADSPIVWSIYPPPWEPRFGICAPAISPLLCPSGSWFWFCAWTLGLV